MKMSTSINHPRLNKEQGIKYILILKFNIPSSLLNILGIQSASCLLCLVFYIIKQDIIYIYMLPRAGQTAKPIGLNFFVDTQGWPGGVLAK